MLSHGRLFVMLVVAVMGKGLPFEKEQGGKAFLNAGGLDRDLRRAMGEALGCGEIAGHEDIPTIKAQLEQMWRTMPKNEYGRVERRLLRYMVHRYFMQRSSLSVRGFEPTRPTNTSSWGDEDILSQRVPAFVEGVLEGGNAANGFTLDAVATMIATVEQLIFDSESSLLETTYLADRGAVESLGKEELHNVLKLYVAWWLIGDSTLSNTADAEGVVPHFKEISDYVLGEINSFELRRWRSLQSTAALRTTATDVAAFAGSFSFSDAHEVVGSITRSFGSYWETVCQDMKRSLVKLDKTHTGRVRISDFYSEGALGSEWRFGESEAYLRMLGALDDSSSWLGKQVIIPNYLQAASNCIVGAQHYSVCCANECEALMGEIEAAVQEPVATPEQILSVVANLTDGGERANEQYYYYQGDSGLHTGLEEQLREVAAGHGGQVPLHGRLFAQWLHYVFPHECPFPHKAGDVRTATPQEFRHEFIATEEEMSVHAENITEEVWNKAEIAPEDAHWMSQWSHEEELLGDYRDKLRAPWKARHGLMAVGGLVLGAIIFAVHSSRHEGSGKLAMPLSLPGRGSGVKMHMV